MSEPMLIPEADGAAEEAPTTRMHDSDNVTIVASTRGLPTGTTLADGTALVEGAPQDHKAALVGLAENDVVICYSEVIGCTVELLLHDSRVNEHVVRLSSTPALDEPLLVAQPDPKLVKLEGYTSEGYRNAGGAVNTKNVLGVMTSVQCMAGVTNCVVGRTKHELLPCFPNVDNVVALDYVYDCGVAINASAATVPVHAPQDLALNPNFSGGIMVTGLDCEKFVPERLIPERLAPDGRIPIEAASTTNSPAPCLQDETLDGSVNMTDVIMGVAECHLEHLSRRQHETCPTSDLVIGMQCGGSGAFSGVITNPAIGLAADLIVCAGSAVMFLEVTGVRDTIHLPAPRAISKDAGYALLHEMTRYDDYLSGGRTDRSVNPPSGNKKGGLSNVVGEAFESIARPSSAPIVDVSGPSERVCRKGLISATIPASDFVCGTLWLTSGMNLQVFATSRNTSYDLAMASVVKVPTRKALSEHRHSLIGLDADRIATDKTSTADIGWELFRLVLNMANGRK